MIVAKQRSVGFNKMKSKLINVSCLSSRL